tara:strand:+ start:1960 stop:2196 length:237 start_codon:yes stop_codon:yes gene_type:complete
MDNIMRVKDLIRKLKTVDPEMEVWIESSSDVWTELSSAMKLNFLTDDNLYTWPVSNDLLQDDLDDNRIIKNEKGFLVS